MKDPDADRIFRTFFRKDPRTAGDPIAKQLFLFFSPTRSPDDEGSGRRHAFSSSFSARIPARREIRSQNSFPYSFSRRDPRTRKDPDVRAAFSRQFPKTCALPKRYTFSEVRRPSAFDRKFFDFVSFAWFERGDFLFSGLRESMLFRKRRRPGSISAFNAGSAAGPPKATGRSAPSGLGLQTLLSKAAQSFRKIIQF